MRIETRYRPEIVCEQVKNLRPQLEHPYLTWADEVAVLVATNGRMLVHIPVTADKKEEEGSVTREAITLARKHRTNRNGDTSMDLDADYITLPNGWKIPRPKELPAFPRWQEVIPKGVPSQLISFNAKFLYDCAKAIGSDTIVMELRSGLRSGEYQPFVIRPADKNDKAFAVLMPCRIA